MSAKNLVIGSCQFGVSRGQYALPPDQELFDATVNLENMTFQNESEPKFTNGLVIVPLDFPEDDEG